MGFECIKVHKDVMDSKGCRLAFAPEFYGEPLERGKGKVIKLYNHILDAKCSKNSSTYQDYYTILYPLQEIVK